MMSRETATSLLCKRGASVSMGIYLQRNLDVSSIWEADEKRTNRAVVLLDSAHHVRPFCRW